jgi:cyanophycinase
MKFLILLFWPIMALANPPVYLFGGGTRDPEALQKFVNEVPKASVLVITWPTSMPEETYQSLSSDLHKAGAHEINHATHVTDKISRQKFLLQLSRANMVFISGGDQNVALDMIDRFDLRSPLQEAFKNGVIFAGTSAGTALMPAIAMTGEGDFSKVGKGLVGSREGLGLIDLLVDQHFLVRSRQNRLKSLLLDNPTKTAVGVDENAAVRVSGKIFEAFGASPITVITTYIDNNEQLFRIELITRPKLTASQAINQCSLLLSAVKSVKNLSPLH